ncbi:hypothetical protein OJAV_G00202450 [Oryzias javanicus]|uniref:Uncharacterized protein n=1 Tax=Oryzias javanicus TaxID=123683 RepID=A0A437C599_ORYJA|nr:hypothetical protein OJAV_G00202450 [Oryzias javanicus]
MAARLLRLSSFKGLQADRWGLLRSPSAVSFCTKTEDPTKPGKKKKVAVKTEAPDLRESLLAYKSTVGFPVRTLQPAVLLTNMVGGAETASTSSSLPAVAASEVESDSSHPAQVVADGASPPSEEAGGEAPAIPAAATEGAPTPDSGDPAAGETSSSSSDSESDSDSDSDDEKSTSAGQASSAEPQRSSAEEEEHPLEVTEEQTEVQGGQEGTASSHVEKAPHQEHPVEDPAAEPSGVPEEELVDPGQVLDGAGELQLEEAAAPEPEEPLDNTTYKNYQHHSYNPYTFADLDLEMAKYRLPQPSSGRPSPQH